MECKFCNNKFKNISSLNNHQKTAKYCLNIQGAKNHDIFECEGCKSTFTLKSTLDKHQIRCVYNTEIVRKMKEQLLLLRQQVVSLQSDKLDLQERYDKLAETLAKRSTTTNNTINNNLNLGVFDKSPEDIKRIVNENYDKNFLLDCQKGVARFTHLHVLKSPDESKPPIYVITDKNRGNGKYKVSDTEVVNDIGMLGLTKKIHPSIKKKAINIANIENCLENEKLFEMYQEVFNMEDDNGIFRKELIKIMLTLSQLENDEDCEIY